MSSSTDLIPVSMLRQHAFCPRIPYFRHRLDIRIKSPHWVDQGIRHEEEETKRSARRKFRRLGLNDFDSHFRPYLDSDREGLRGRPDLVLETAEEVIPAEYKLSRPTRLSGTRLQLIAYGRMAEEYYGKPFRRAALLARNAEKPEWLRLTHRTIDQYRRALAALQHNMSAITLPDTPATVPQCSQCEFLRLCNDRF